MAHTDTLNSAQKDAVLATEGPLLVLAGAGAGKTRVITHRILEIVRRGTAPEAILAITFTNKAAGEMRDRVTKLLASDPAITRPAYEEFRPPFVSTFHSLGLRIIKENFRLLGYKRIPAIYDRADSMRAIKEALKSLGAEDVEPRTALSRISRAKGDGITASAFAESVTAPFDRTIAEVWLRYEAALRKDTSMDFDDLLCSAVRLLQDKPEVRAHYQGRWKYVHVDEYQDTNGIQALMTELLLGPELNICAVGDIDQTIYGWRGAQIANIMSFEKKFRGARNILLEENYRSTKNILQAANDIISKNTNRLEKNLFTKNVDGENLSIYQAFDETDEAGFIARIIKEKLQEGYQPRDFAVLYRANFQSRAIEEQLLHADIDHQVLGTRFFERKEVKDALCYVRAAIGGTQGDLARIINTPVRGIGKVTLTKILMDQEHMLTGAIAEKVANFRRLLKRIADAAERLTPSELLRFTITESKIEDELKADKIEGAERLENLRELVSLASRYDHLPLGDGLQAFLESASLQSDQDELKDTTNAVRLMTVHASKGLEFPVVFIAGLEEGLFPYEREGDSSADKEEERRLMYVAITRAEKKLYLSYASYRTVFGSKNATSPSSFLSDLP
ncbi:MAG: ATP-dependent helicase PcrA, helicase / ATP-dependent helicase PcrA, partial [Candidatus Adlerbacteria bacterium]|nr:ATP-dependent helicase PcrA, helicase / ATP-dependent helicase PcrA [Candidatus Adlerbacteria bacterium]